MIDYVSRVRVAFSAGLYEKVTHCSHCGRHKFCRGDDERSLVCLDCFDRLGHEFPKARPERTSR